MSKRRCSSRPVSSCSADGRGASRPNSRSNDPILAIATIRTWWRLDGRFLELWGSPHEVAPDPRAALSWGGDDRGSDRLVVDHLRRGRSLRLFVVARGRRLSRAGLRHLLPRQGTLPGFPSALAHRLL